MANKKSRDWLALALIVAISIIAVLPFVLSSWFLKAPRTPVIAPTVQPTVTVPLLPPTSIVPVETVPIPTPPPIVPSVQQADPVMLPSVIPPAVRAEVAEVKEHVTKTAEDLTETIKEFRKEADDLDLGE